jgi:hypothetical protein
MKLSSVARLLSGTLSPAAFVAEIEEELAVHRAGLSVRGGVAPVRVDEDEEVVLDRPGLRRLCEAFLSGELTAEQLAYIADAMQLSDRVEFSGHRIADDLAMCTDPEINGPMDAARAWGIVQARESRRVLW